MIGTWNAYLYDINDAFVAEIPFDGLTVTKKLNDIWTASINVEYFIFKDWIVRQGTTVDAVLSSGLRWVDIKRNDTTIFRGILTEAPISYSGQNTQLSLQFKSWLAYFQKRFITKDYTSDDAGDIAWDMIATAQAETDGSIGITEGTITATKTRDRTFARDEIAKKIIDMGYQNIIDGYEFEISDLKVFTCKARLGTDKPAIVFDETKIINHRINYMIGLSIVTQSTQLGNGTGADQLIETATSTATYTEKWYLQEKMSSNTSVSESATLTDHADQELANNQDVRKVFDITVTTDIDPTSYDISDGVMVEIEDIIDGLFTIKSKTYQVNEGNETVKLEFM